MHAATHSDRRRSLEEHTSSERDCSAIVLQMREGRRLQICQRAHGSAAEGPAQAAPRQGLEVEQAQ